MNPLVTAEPSESAADALGFVRLDGAGVVRLSKVNGVVFPEDMPGRLDQPIVIIGVLSIPVERETAKDAAARLLVSQPSHAPLAGEKEERRMVRLSPEEWGAKNRHVQALEEAIVMANEVTERCKAAIASQQRQMLFLHEKLMQGDGLPLNSPLMEPEARMDLGAAIEKAMEAEGSRE